MHDLLQNIRSSDSISLTSDIRELHASDSTSFANLLNTSKYSAVSLARDTYAEDIVLQKVIYYISLFKNDVR